MNKDMLYTVNSKGTRTCKVCEMVDDHDDECPGKIIESLRFSVQVMGSNCGRSCCGYTDTHVTGDTREEAIMNALVDVGYNQRHSAYIRYVSDEDDCTPEYYGLADTAYEAKKREEEAARAKGIRDSRIAEMVRETNSLLAQKNDFTEEAFARKRKEIEEKYADLGVP